MELLGQPTGLLAETIERDVLELEQACVADLKALAVDDRAGSVARHGFEPTRESPTCVRLRNCPFHPLAAKAPDLVCGINHEFLGGVLAGLHATSVEAVLAPKAGECCVELRRVP